MSTVLGKRKSAPTVIVKKWKKKTKTSGSLVPLIKKIIHGESEVKGCDTRQTANPSRQNIDFSGVQYALLTPSQGTTSATRVGDKVTIKSVEIRITWTLGTSPNRVRTILYQWHDKSDASHPVAADILAVLGNADAPTSAKVFENSRSFTVLRDDQCILDTYRPAVDLHYYVRPQFNRKKLGMQPTVEFTAGSATLQSNGLFLLFVSDDGVATYPSISFYSRVLYTDM